MTGTEKLLLGVLTLAGACANPESDGIGANGTQAALVSGPVIYTNLGPGKTFDPGPGHGWGINGYVGPSFGQQAISHQFTPNEDTRFGSAEVALVAFTGPGVVDVYLQEDSGGLPGEVIDQIRLGGLSSTPTLLMARSESMPRLAADEPYWLTVVAGGPGMVGGWSWNSIGDEGRESFATTQAGSPNGPWGIFRASQTRSAFQINAAPTPQAVISFAMAELEQLAADGNLDDGLVRSLLTKLQSSLTQLEANRLRPACNVLSALLHELDALAASGALEQQRTDRLRGLTERARRLMDC